MEIHLYMGPTADMVVWSEEGGGEGVVLLEPYIGAR